LPARLATHTKIGHFGDKILEKVTTQKSLVTCVTQTDDIVMTWTTEVTTHDPSDNQ
jgi:hypothetical protein